MLEEKETLKGFDYYEVISNIIRKLGTVYGIIFLSSETIPLI